ncbi:MAG: 4Fe-4S binding protein [Opitutales bacterium]
MPPPEAMRRRGLKFLRAALATAVLAGLAAAFLDFRAAMPPAAGHLLAAVQFLPSAVALVTGAGLSLACVVILAVTLLIGRVYCSVLCPLGIFQDAVARVAGWIRRRRPRLPYRPALTWVRQLFLWGTVAGLAAGWAGLTLSLLDPYSIFGRITSDLFRPVVTLANNALVGPIGQLGVESLVRVTPQWAGVGALAVPAAMLLVVAGLAAWRGRLYCNTICPVGTLLGWISARSALRLAIDLEACRKCGDCVRRCKAQCIDLRAGTIDHSRCVSCYNCLDACGEAAIRHRATWWRPRFPVQPEPSQPSAAVSSSAKPRSRQAGDHSGLARPDSGNEGGVHCPQCAGLVAGEVKRVRDNALHLALWQQSGGQKSDRTDLTQPAMDSSSSAPDVPRRTFLATTAAALVATAGAGSLFAATAKTAPAKPVSRNASPVICPPGSESVGQYLDRCTACHLCVSACPTHVLQPAFWEYGLPGLMKPRLDYAAAFCNFDCQRCAEVCPDGAISLTKLAEKQVTRIGLAQFNQEKCIVVVSHTDCAACSEHCPTKAVDTVPYGRNLRLPQVTDSLCIGCGACEYACPAKPQKAITVSGRYRHEQAVRRREEKAKDPRAGQGGDFPF